MNVRSLFWGSSLLLLSAVHTSPTALSAPQLHPEVSAPPTPEEVAAFLETQAEAGALTSALLVKKGGETLFEIYPRDHTASTKNLMFSVSKSLTSLALGIALDEFGGDINASICEWITPTADERICEASLKDVLHMSSGIGWSEAYSEVIDGSHVLRMLYGRGVLDMSAFVASLPQIGAPGSTFNYSTGDTQLLSRVLHSLTGEQSQSYIRTALFDHLGITDFIWEQDSQGVLIGGAQSYFTAPDMAKIGEFMLAGGQMNGEQIIPQTYFQDSLTASEAVIGGETRTVPYGYQWWLNRAEASAEARWTNATDGTFAALGHWGQSLIMIPEEETVVVRFAEDKTSRFDMNGLLGLLRGIPAMPEEPQTSATLGNKGPVSTSPEETLEQSLGYQAQFYCSCVLVSERSPEACIESMRTPEVPEPAVSFISENTAQSELAGRGKRAIFTEGEGCRLESDMSFPIEG